MSVRYSELVKLQVGDLVENNFTHTKYCILHRVGQGKFGSCFEAVQLPSHQPYVLKVLSKEGLDPDSSVLEIMTREPKMLKYIKKKQEVEPCDYIIRFLDSFEFLYHEKFNYTVLVFEKCFPLNIAQLVKYGLTEEEIQNHFLDSLKPHLKMNTNTMNMNMNMNMIIDYLHFGNIDLSHSSTSTPYLETLTKSMSSLNLSSSSSSPFALSSSSSSSSSAASTSTSACQTPPPVDSVREQWLQKYHQEYTKFYQSAKPFLVSSKLKLHHQTKLKQDPTYRYYCIVSFPEKYLKEFAKQLLSCVLWLHKQHIAHHDIKLDNLLYQDAFSQIRLTDFGFASHLDKNEYITQQKGSWFYLAPEIVSAQKYRFESDVWSIGVCMFLLATRRFPFFSQDKQKLVYRIKNKTINFPKLVDKKILSSALADLLSKMLQKDPQQRILISDALRHPWLIH